jgi:hypothetical protein
MERRSAAQRRSHCVLTLRLPFVPTFGLTFRPSAEGAVTGSCEEPVIEERSKPVTAPRRRLIPAFRTHDNLPLVPVHEGRASKAF